MALEVNGVIAIDKPGSITSHDVVDALRKQTGIRKIGHTGTLDPMATGVLVMVIGKATRVAQYLDLEPKEYIAKAVFGVTTSTQDAMGQIVTDSNELTSQEALECVIPEYIGDFEQIPPMVSAVKINGTALYKLARKGKEVERAPRPITVHSIEVLAFGEVEGRSVAKLRVVCGKGTYVRTLVHDIGARLGLGATLSGLLRTRVGAYTLADCHKLDSITSAEALALQVTKLKDALSHICTAVVGENGARLISHGNAIDETRFTIMSKMCDENIVCVQDGAGTVLAIGRILRVDGMMVLQPEIVLV